MSSSKIEKAYLLLGVSLVFAIRLLLFGQDPNPPGDDPGMHSGFIYLILKYAQLPRVSPYHMPGTPFTYPPAFHLLGGAITLVTGLPIVTTVFLLGLLLSMVLAIPLYAFAKTVTKSVLISLGTMFLFALSIPDLYMMCWGGFVNIFALFFFYTLLWLAVKEISPVWKLIVPMGVLAGAFFSVHYLSLLVYIAILCFSYIFIAIYYFRKQFSKWDISPFITKTLASASLGGLLALPVLYESFAYNLQATFQASIIKETLLYTRIVTWEIIAYSLKPAVFWGFALLGIMALQGLTLKPKLRNVVLFSTALVPILLTQSYLIGIVTDYQRFLAFSVHAIFILTAAGIWAVFQVGQVLLSTGFQFIRHFPYPEYLRTVYRYFRQFPYPTEWVSLTKKLEERYLLRIWDAVRKQSRSEVWRVVFSKKSLLALLILAIISQPIADELVLLPRSYSAFHLAQRPVTDSIYWIAEKTPEDAVMVTDHSYGWWVAGLAHRPTLSATPIQFLSHSYEAPLALDADFINDASYQIENGIMRIRDTGPFGGNHNPIITVIREKALFDTILYFNDTETIVLYRQAGGIVEKSISDFREKGIQWISRTEDMGLLLTRYKDQNIEVTKEIGVFRLMHYMSINYSVKSEEMSKLLLLKLGMRVRQDRNNFYMTENRLGFFSSEINTAVNIFFDKPIFGPFRKIIPREFTPSFVFVALNETEFTLQIKVGLDYMGRQRLTLAEQIRAVDFLAETQYQDIKYGDQEVTTLDYREILNLHKVSILPYFMIQY